ncbi:uncharacterized protein LOC127115226 [Lathyrus oleraceus]|uniref:uncharacterized protein LOC127115226 n=1 Tax=Pisum sativum TaxID=3888 RepID=UPI0021D1E90A|nr:uncharacterized protein LOC127115226 [Pisum sativum]
MVVIVNSCLPPRIFTVNRGFALLMERLVTAVLIRCARQTRLRRPKVHLAYGFDIREEIASRSLDYVNIRSLADSSPNWVSERSCMKECWQRVTMVSLEAPW